MADNVYTKVLKQAADMEGSTQALAARLRVPENTLLRWMSGRAQMPLRAFLRVVELVSQHEQRNGDAASARTEVAHGDNLSFAMGELQARCARCDGTEFALTDRGPLRMTSELACGSCGERVVHGDLVSQLARDAVQQSRAMTVARNRRQAHIGKHTTKPLA